MATTAEINAFIKKLGALAVAECNNRIAAGKGFVLPSVCIAQSALETGWGDSGLMTRANAFFGIKAGGSWTGSVYTADTWEVANGEAYNTTANFRAYDSLQASVTDYYDLIGNNSRYANALSYGTDPTAWKTPKACITAIWSGGYATDTLYVEKIMNTINARNLASYDSLITGEGVELNKYYTFKLSDLVNGTLVTADSNRTIANDTSVKGSVALDWNKAIEINVTGAYTITMKNANLISNPDIKLTSFMLSRLINDTATQDLVEDFNKEFTELAIAVTQNEKIGFDLTPETPTDITIADINPDIEITFTPHNIGYNLDNNESYGAAIAFFVKVE